MAKLTKRQTGILGALRSVKFVPATDGMQRDIAALRKAGHRIDSVVAHQTDCYQLVEPESAFDTDIDAGDENDNNDWGV